MNNNRLDSNNKVALVAAFGEDVVKVEGRIAEFGGFDAAFSNAGVMVRVAPTAESTREEWGRVSGIDLRGVWN